jgi:uncharacterized delta-60 repeat protein
MVRFSWKRTDHRRFIPGLEPLEVRALLSAGSLDPTFGAQGNGITSGGAVASQLQGQDSAYSVAIQPDGKIVVAGSSAQPSTPNLTEYGIVRYSTNGTLDTTFGTNGIVLGSVGENITEIAVAANGAIIASGTANLGAVVFEFNSNGTLNASFGRNGIVTVDGSPGSTAEAIVLQPDGKIVGVVEDPHAMFTSIFRLDADGMPDTSFVSPALPVNFTGQVSLALAPDGKIVLGAMNSGAMNMTVFRLNADGSQDASFGANGSLQVPDIGPFGLAVQADNRLIVASTLLGSAGPSFTTLDFARYNVNGTRDVVFNENGAGNNVIAGGITPPSVLIQPDGRIVISCISVNPFTGTQGIEFASIDLERMNPNGSLDPTFGNGGMGGALITGSSGSLISTHSVAAATLQQDGDIVVVGQWATKTTNDFLTTRFLGDTSSGTVHQQFVSQVYLDLLERPADAAGLAHWSGLLDSGQETGQQVALGIEASPEYHALVVNQLYGEYLGRAADAGGLASWSTFLAGGGTIDQLRAVLLGSSEYFADSGNTNSGFVSALYRDVLGRPVDSGGQQGWSQVLASGASRTAVAGSIIRSFEGNNREVSDLYFWLLHRAPDSVGLQAFAQQLAQGIPVENIAATLIGSAEYAATRA